MTADAETEARLEALIRRETRVLTPALTPELRFYGADDLTTIWAAGEAELAAMALAPPFWAFAWPGGQALARAVLDAPDLVRGARVLALAAGGGLEAAAAARSGAASVTANDVDPAALVACRLNAALNGVSVAFCGRDRLAAPDGADLAGFDVILAGDVYYAADLALRLDTALAAAAARGAVVLVGDPGRGFPARLPAEALADYEIAVDPRLEDVATRRPRVLRLRAGVVEGPLAAADEIG